MALFTSPIITRTALALALDRKHGAISVQDRFAAPLAEPLIGSRARVNGGDLITSFKASYIECSVDLLGFD